LDFEITFAVPMSDIEMTWRRCEKQPLSDVNVFLKKAMRERPALGSCSFVGFVEDCNVDRGKPRTPSDTIGDEW
jgi:hypothetical protein